MKKQLLILLLLVSSISLGQTTLATKLKITGNSISTTAPFINVQETNGEVNKINKSDLVDVIQVASAINLPVTGVAGKFYYTQNDKKYYTWNGTIYTPIVDDSNLLHKTGDETKTGVLIVTTDSETDISVSGINTSTGSGISGTSVGGPGVVGISSTDTGVAGQSTSGYGIAGNSNTGLGGFFNTNSGATIAAFKLNTVDKVVIKSDGKITATAGTEPTDVIVKSQLDEKANLDSPNLTGTPTAPTATVGTNTTQIATTAFVNSNTNWTKTGNDIRNNNSGKVKIGSDYNYAFGGALEVSKGVNHVSIAADGKIAAVGGFVIGDQASGMGFFNNSALQFTSYGSNGFRFNPIYLNATDHTITPNKDIVSFLNSLINPTSGSVNFNMYNISPIVNQTGGANGITRSIYINPTLTSATDFRAIEVTAGKVIIPNGTASNEAVNKGQLDAAIAGVGGGGGGGGSTNLTTTQSPTTVTVNSDTGTDATIVLANGTNAGVSTNDYTTAEKSKLAGIASGATANSSDATLLDRANHTGTQTASTISDFNTSVDSRIAISSPNLSFLNVAYASTITRAYDNLRPNLEIDITGNIDFTLTGTSSGDSGLLNLYFSATEVATLNGVTDLIVTGAGAMIPVYFVHDSDGIKWYKDEVGGGTVDTSLFALKNGTILYHTLPFTGITSTITTLGTDVTISAGQFPNDRSLGNKITINGESRIITAWLDWNHVTVDSAFSTNYTNEPKVNWDFYSKAVEIDNTATIYFYNRIGFTTSKNDGSSSKFSVEEIISPQNTYSLGQDGLKFRADRVIRHSNGTSAGDTADIGLRRNSAGIYEVYDGNNPNGLEANRRDLLVRNLIGGVTIGNDSSTASSGNVGKFRYTTTSNSSNLEMVMQTGATTYEWVNILSNNW